MSQEASQQLPHIQIRDTPSSELYRNPSDERYSFRLKPRNRIQHGQRLRAQLAAVEKAVQRALLKAPTEEPAARGIYLEFESDKGFDLKIESLEARKQGVELVAVHEEGDKESERLTRATVFAREGKVEYFAKKIDEYLNEETDKGKPLNQPLVDSISSVRVGRLKGVWKGSGRLPSSDKAIWWEAWLRKGNDEEERETILRLFRESAGQYGMTLSRKTLLFPESTVLLIHATTDQLSELIYPLNVLAELRMAKETAEFYTRMSRVEQVERVRDLSSRIRPADHNAPVVCLLDTGVNNNHPLLTHGLSDDDMHAYNNAWGYSDHVRAYHKGHGTQMAGLALYGDLINVLATSTEVPLTHRLESVKIIPPSGSNQPELYGVITGESIARAEERAPHRNRAVCLTATTTDFRDRGKPSSWSSAIDQICSGALEEDDDAHRLLLVAAGNVEPSGHTNYPVSNVTDGIHDPGQAWNAVTVGAYTDKDHIDPTDYPEWSPLAPKGELSPCSTTSIIWMKSQWPLKPDIMMEGGNMGTHSELGVDYIDSLQLLSTYADWQNKLLVTTGDTSGATALAAGMCAKIYAEYPALWPETIRGLLIHSARWTPSMLSGKDLWDISRTGNEREELLRKYGYGVPNLNKALYSASDSLTLIAQQHITPYVKEDGSIKTNEMHLHALPWPREALEELGGNIVEMRVTLSYFIQPKPEHKGFKTKYRYASHGLRFDMNKPREQVDDFRKRINRIARDGQKFNDTEGDSSDWFLGSDLRTRGSIHSDIWRGPAVNLAAKDHIAVCPVKGWWSESPYLQKWEGTVRYSLIINITTPSLGVDIYTPVLTSILV
jgi:hypothetical protein